VKRRLVVFVALVALWIAAIGAQLWNLQVVRHEEFARRAERQQQRVVELDPPRGTIYDAEGRELAVSMEVDSAFAVPREVGDVAATARRLAPVLHMERAKLERQLAADREFVWVARKLDPPEARAVKALDLPGIYFLQESKRYYPMRELAAQVLGYVGTDNDGLAGLEALYDKTVAGQPGRRTVLRDARQGMAVPPDLPSAAAVAGSDLRLTLDSSVQQIVEEELDAAYTSLHAKSASAVVLDPWTGAILALASRPTFDPNEFRTSSADERRDRPVQDAYEPGSTFKMVTVSAALEEGLVAPSDRFDCEMGAITLAGVRIKDHKPFGVLTVADIIQKSSNVGAIKIALRLPTRDFYDAIRTFGFGEATGVDLPGESPGLLMPLDRWPALAKAYIAFGQGISVTPLQLAVAFAAIANGGELLQPYVVDAVGSGASARALHPQPIVRRRVDSARTVATVQALLARVTEQGGTGTAASNPGYPAAGKTGTAQKAEPGRGYLPDQYVASFVGWVPRDHPRFVAAVVVDAPHGKIYGGDAAAPAFGAIARRVLLAHNVRPERERPDLWPFQPQPQKTTTTAEAATEPAAPPPPGTFPDLVGRTARDAVAETTRLELVPVLRGQGLVVRQSPPPGTPLPARGSRVELVLDVGSKGG